MLESIVLNDIHSYAQLAEVDRQYLIDRVLSTLKSENHDESDRFANQLANAEKKTAEITATVKKLYKDKLDGKMPETLFFSLLSDYEKEQQTLETEIPKFREQLKIETGHVENVTRWVDTIRKYLNVQHLDRLMARGADPIYQRICIL